MNELYYLLVYGIAFLTIINLIIIIEDIRNHDLVIDVIKAGGIAILGFMVIRLLFGGFS